MNRRLIALLVAQTIGLVLLGWAAAYLGRDEFHLLADRDEEEVPTGSRVLPGDADDPAALPVLHLSVAAQRQIGLALAPASAARVAPSVDWSAQVLDAAPLAEWRGRLRAAAHEAQAAQAAARASAAEARRARALFDDDRQGSLRAAEAAEAQAGADAARERAATAAHDALRATARAAWGARVTGWLDGADAAPLARLAQGDEVLLRAAPVGGGAPAATATLVLHRPDGGPLTARALDPAPVADGAGARAWLFTAPGRGLAPGQRLAARAPTTGAGAGLGVEGAWLPDGAVLWHAGQAWAWRPMPEAGAAAPAAAASAAPAQASPPAKTRDRDDDDDDERKPAPAPAAGAAPAAPTRFQRLALPGAHRVDGRWFVPGLAGGTPLVVQGTQLLLSEELKATIRNENDD